MAHCEDFPCCGHEYGCCPDFDENGVQLNMKCVCGATVPLTSRYSLCHACLNGDVHEGGWDDEEWDEEDEGDWDEDEREYDDPLVYGEE